MNRKSFTAALCAGLAAAAIVTARPAAAEQYYYKGHDATYSNIQMELYITKVAGPGYDATGSIYVGNIRDQVKGTFSGSGLSATVAFPLQFSGTASRVPVTGTLSGALGKGAITATTGNVLISGKYYMLHFTLMPPAVSTPPPPRVPPAPAPPTPPRVVTAPTLPSAPVAMNFQGSAGFGYTRVVLALHFQPSGSGYQVSGQATVHSIRPRDVTTVLNISGFYNPASVPARMTVTGAPAGSSPGLACTLQGKTLNTQMTGMPALGITSLYITAKAP